MISANSRYICANLGCGGPVSPLLAEDEPGEHTYVFACRTCHREYGSEWTEYHHSFLGMSEPAPALDLEPFSGTSLPPQETSENTLPRLQPCFV